MDVTHVNVLKGHYRMQGHSCHAHVTLPDLPRQKPTPLYPWLSTCNDFQRVTVFGCAVIGARLGQPARPLCSVTVITWWHSTSVTMASAVRTLQVFGLLLNLMKTAARIPYRVLHTQVMTR